MSTTDMADTPDTAAERVVGIEKPEPQPWRSPEDAKGWKVIARGRRRPQPPPLISVEVELDRERSDWLRQEADRTGLGYDELVLELIDEARAARAKQAKGAEGEATRSASAQATT